MDQNEIIRRFFLEGNPNPERQACPGPDILRAIGEDALPANDPARIHISACSPCFREYSQFKHEYSKRVRLRNFALLVTGVIVLSAIGITILRRAPSQSDPAALDGRPSPGNVFPQAAFISYDAGALSEARGAHSLRAMKPMKFVRTRSLHLSITLPLGMDPGTYETRLCQGDDGNPVYSSTNATAMTAAGGTTVLRTILRTDGLPSGDYQFYFRPTGDVQWWPLAAVLR